MSAARFVGLLTAAVTVASLCLLEYPTVFGRWEQYGVVRMLIGEGPRFTLEIRPGGPIYGSNHYPLVDLGYLTAEWLGWSLRAVRLPVLVAGAAAVGLFWVIAGRAFGFWPGLVGALALALNPMFLVFWHQQLVPMFTMLALLLFIERYQWFELTTNRRLLWSVPMLAVTFVILMLHYALGRIAGGIVVGYWVVLVAWRTIGARRAGRPIDRVALAALLSFGLLVILLALLVSSQNTRYLADPSNVLVTPRSEFIRSVEQAWVVGLNVPIALTALIPPLNLAPGRLGEFSSDLIVDIRSHLLPTSMLPLILVGLGAVISRLRWSSISRLTLVLLVGMFTAPLLSDTYNGYLTISSFRMFFVLAPLYLCAAAGAGWLLVRRSPALRLGAAGLLLGLLVIQGITTGGEVVRHRAFIDDLTTRWALHGADALFGDEERQRASREYDLMTNGSYQYYVDLSGVGSRADARAFAASAPRPESDDEVVVVRLEGDVAKGNPSVALRLVFYLHELGVAAALFDPETGTHHGSGWRQPSHILVANDEQARQARQSLRRTDVKVIRWRFTPTG